MTTPTDVKDIIAAAGGSLTGRTRLQKSAYFLEVCGVGFGFDFNYHYYGPYSDELSTAAADASALDFISLNWNTSQSGFPYAIYRTAQPSSEADADRLKRQREILHTLDQYDAVSLELAATAHFLAENGFGDDPWGETERRKAGKATRERISRAKDLLSNLGFSKIVDTSS